MHERGAEFAPRVRRSAPLDPWRRRPRTDDDGGRARRARDVHDDDESEDAARGAPDPAGRTLVGLLRSQERDVVVEGGEGAGESRSLLQEAPESSLLA